MWQPLEPVVGLDPEIADIVNALRESGVETYESCQGGQDHSYPEPSVRFYGNRSEGFRALCAAQNRGLRVVSLRRIWQVIDDEPVGPDWEMTFMLHGDAVLWHLERGHAVS